MEEDTKFYSVPNMDALYSRQVGDCHLELEIIKDDKENIVDTVLYCCGDGYRELTSELLNPSNECMKCITSFMNQLMKE